MSASLSPNLGGHDRKTSEEYTQELHREFPKLRVIDKSSDPFSKLIDRALWIVTVGGQSSYMTQYVTTIGQTIYLPSSWPGRDDKSRYITLRHEAVHLRQFRRFTLVGMSLLYLLPILPMFLAWGRARLEWEAYRETLQAVFDVRGREAALAPELKAHITRQFVSGAYGWMWPFRAQVEAWVDQATQEIVG